MSYKKVFFMGNSLLLGMFELYGMCSTDPQSDYAHYVSCELKKREPDCEISKLRVSKFEGCESREEFELWFESVKHYFKEDLDLVTLQLLDNVNNEARQAAFRDNFPELLRRITTLCPKARVVWIYGWYMQPSVLDFAINTVDSFGIERIDISSTHTKENESYSGQSCVNAEGEQQVVEDEWITHPGNSGMKAIAEILIDRLFDH